jgi:hypothetical protein
MTWQAVALGCAVGLVASMPAAWASRSLLRDRGGVACVRAGLVYVLASYMALACAVALVWSVAPTQVAGFAIAMAVAFVAAWLAMGLRSWREPQEQDA